MNTRIRKLFSKSCWDEQTEVDIEDFISVEKFAELIVQECIVQIQLTTARDPQNTPQYRQSVGHIHRIRQHFGIEK